MLAKLYSRQSFFRLFTLVLSGFFISACQPTKPLPNGMNVTDFEHFLNSSSPSAIEPPYIDQVPYPGKVAVNATSRRQNIEGTEVCRNVNVSSTVSVLEGVDAPEGYGLDDRYNSISNQFKQLSEFCLAGSVISCNSIQTSALKWAKESKLNKPRSTDGGKWNDTLTINMRLLSPMLSALGVAEEFTPLSKSDREILIPWLVRIADNFEHGMRADGSYKGGSDGTTARKAAHNHAVQSSNAQMSLGSYLGDSRRFNIGIEQWFITLKSMRGDGSLPIETRRGARALFYQGRTITGLASLAEKAKAQGVDLWNVAPNQTQTIHMAVKFLIDAVENPDFVIKYAATNKAPGPSKNYKIQDVGSGSTFGWIAPYLARFPNHPNSERLLKRIQTPNEAIKNYLTDSLDRQIKSNGTDSGDWNFVNGKCFYSNLSYHSEIKLQTKLQACKTPEYAELVGAQCN